MTVRVCQISTVSAFPQVQESVFSADLLNVSSKATIIINKISNMGSSYVTFIQKSNGLNKEFVLNRHYLYVHELTDLFSFPSSAVLTKTQGLNVVSL